MKSGVKQKAPQSRGFFVDPPGLEPGLCGTKIRRVANYTMGHSTLKGAAKLEKKFNSYNPLIFLIFADLSNINIIFLYS